jgi:hypothetical protein
VPEVRQEDPEARPSELGPTHRPQPPLPLRTVALPNEHGVWGFLLEPIVLGLLLVPSGAGALVAAGSIFGVLVQHPAAIAAADARSGRNLPRSHLARGAAVVYGTLALYCLAFGAALGQPLALVPLALAAPAGLVVMHYDRLGRSRALAPELAGALALPTIAAAIVLVGGGAVETAVVATLALLARTVPTVLYVRARLRVEKGTPLAEAGAGPAVAASAVAAVAVALGVVVGILPWPAAVAFGLLLARAAHGLSPWRKPARATTVGVREIAFGLVVTLALVSCGGSPG